MSGIKLKKWWQYVLLIPFFLFIDGILLILAILADTLLFHDPSYGDYGIPAATIIMAMLLSSVTIIVITLALSRAVICLSSASKRNSVKEDCTKENQNTEFYPSDSVKTIKETLPGFVYFLPIIIQIILTIAASVISGLYEINRFYEDSAHIGFAIPVCSIMLAIAGLIITVITGLICLFLYQKNKKE